MFLLAKKPSFISTVSSCLEGYLTTLQHPKTHTIEVFVNEESLFLFIIFPKFAMLKCNTKYNIYLKDAKLSLDHAVEPNSNHCIPFPGPYSSYLYTIMAPKK